MSYLIDDTRLSKLEEVRVKLKQEFIGLDNIIDDIITSITPWYLTPDILNRPVVISLWGMTGTGKTSLVNRLTELLELLDHTINFDCSNFTNTTFHTVVQDKVKKLLVGDYCADVYLDQPENSKDLIMIFDEFQHARTISDLGYEMEKSCVGDLWSLIDSGKLINTPTNDYQVSNIVCLLDDIKNYSRINPNISIKNRIVNDPDEVKEILDNLGFSHFEERTRTLGDEIGSLENPYRPLKIISDSTLCNLIKRCNKDTKVTKDTLAEFNNCTTISELCEVLDKYRQKLVSQTIINCSKSLIFIIGNLDEAFGGKEFSPDIDADIYYEITSKVTISDIKEALKKRFRVEQIARFGNIILKYPTLNKSSFKEIIKKESTRLTTEFKNLTDINVEITSDFLELIYSEGVFPVQGVRPVFSTINNIITPLFHKILLNKLDEKEDIYLDIDTTAGFKVDTINLLIKTKDTVIETIPYNLTLGSIRNPEQSKTRYINSVHEIGHAIVLTYLTGVLPVNVVSVSVEGGGFCSTYDPGMKEISSIQDIKNNICISMAGYLAEDILVKNNKTMHLLGSNSDIDKAWKLISTYAYRGGYFGIPFNYTNSKVEQCIDGIPSGIDNGNELDNLILDEFNSLMELTKKILIDNIKLLANSALLLGDKGEITEEEFKDLINKYGITLTEDRIKKAKELNSADWYKNELLKIIG